MINIIIINIDIIIIFIIINRLSVVVSSYCGNRNKVHIYQAFIYQSHLVS